MSRSVEDIQDDIIKTYKSQIETYERIIENRDKTIQILKDHIKSQDTFIEEIKLGLLNIKSKI